MEMTTAHLNLEALWASLKFWWQQEKEMTFSLRNNNSDNKENSEFRQLSITRPSENLLFSVTTNSNQVF